MGLSATVYQIIGFEIKEADVFTSKDIIVRNTPNLCCAEAWTSEEMRFCPKCGTNIREEQEELTITAFGEKYFDKRLLGNSFQTILEDATSYTVKPGAVAGWAGNKNGYGNSMVRDADHEMYLFGYLIGECGIESHNDSTLCPLSGSDVNALCVKFRDELEGSGFPDIATRPIQLWTVMTVGRRIR